MAAAAGDPAATRESRAAAWRAAAWRAAAPSSRVLAPPLRRADPSGTFATSLAFHGRHVTARHARPAPPALPGPAATCGLALSPPLEPSPRGALGKSWSLYLRPLSSVLNQPRGKQKVHRREGATKLVSATESERKGGTQLPGLEIKSQRRTLDKRPNSIF